MELAEIRKGLIAALGAVVVVIPQVLTLAGGLLPEDAASGLSITAAVATAALVYLVPNQKSFADQTVTAVDALSPVIDDLQKRVRRLEPVIPENEQQVGPR